MDIKHLTQSLLEMIVNTNIRQITKKQMKQRFGRRAVAGIEEAEYPQIYLEKGEPYYEKITSLLHELSHFYRDRFQYAGEENDEEKTQTQAMYWQQIIYGPDECLTEYYKLVSEGKNGERRKKNR